MLEKLFGAVFSRVIVPVAAGLGRVGLSANALTVLGLVVTLLSSVVIARGPGVTAGLVLLGGALFDTLDGAVARVTGSSSRRGAFLDSTLDRLGDAAMFLGVVWRFTGGPESAGGGGADAVFGPAPGAAIALIAMVLGLMVSYVRARAEGLGFECKVGIAERPERIILVAAGLLFNLLAPALALLAAASAVTLVQRFVHVWRQAQDPL